MGNSLPKHTYNENVEVVREFELQDMSQIGETKLSDINLHCLEKILEYLSFADLLNVCDLNQTLQNMASSVFKRKFSNKKVHISDMIRTPYRIYEVNDDIRVRDLKSIFQILRCFGNSIKILEICGDRYPFQFYNRQNRLANMNQHRVVCYVNEYCGAVREIKYVNFPQNALESVRNPFQHAETVTFASCDLGRAITRFNIWFPVMRRLILDRNTFEEPTCIAVHFPHLQDFHLYNINLRNLHWPCIERALELNPQLQFVYTVSPQLIELENH